MLTNTHNKNSNNANKLKNKQFKCLSETPHSSMAPLSPALSVPGLNKAFAHINTQVWFVSFVNLFTVTLKTADGKLQKAETYSMGIKGNKEHFLHI